MWLDPGRAMARFRIIWRITHSGCQSSADPSWSLVSSAYITCCKVRLEEEFREMVGDARD